MSVITSFFKKEVVAHPISRLALGAVGVIALGSGGYYYLATRTPGAVWASPAQSAIEEVVLGTGSVEPAQNPDLAFASGGRVTYVAAAVGAHVSKGQLLASLDTASLGAQRSQAQANLKAQQAKLSEMQAGPRQVDVAAKQTAVDQANTALANLYASIPANLAQAYDKSFSGVSAYTDTLFNQPNSPAPSLAFSTSNSQLAIDATTQRAQAAGALSQWSTEVNALTGSAAPAAIDSGLSSSVAHLSTLRTYCDTLLLALGSAVPSSTFPQSSIASSQTSVTTLRDTINTQIIALQALQQQIKSDTLGVQSAQDALNQTNAGSTPQDIAAQQATVEAAQASVANFDAQIANSQIVAPFSGVVASVAAKPGTIVVPNTVAISLTPESALQIVVYVSEVDMAKLAVGNMAAVTLDAYGASRAFPAQVVSIDRSPTQQNGIPGYKVTLQFQSDDAAIASGMTANVTIVAAQKDSALTIPKSAVLTQGGQTFVLVSSPQGPVERQVELGIIGTSSVEVLSGLSATDRFLLHTK